MNRFRVIFPVLLALAISTSVLAVSGLLSSSSAGAAMAPSYGAASGVIAGPGVDSSSFTVVGLPDVIGTAQRSSLFLTPACWVFVVGAWMWRGRVRARWREVGFESDVFELFMKMKGGATRIKLLNALEIPKDRLQVAEQLGLDWKAVDRHVQVLNKYGFVREKAIYGTTKVYEVTPLGKTLLKLYDELEEADRLRLVEQVL